MIVRPSAASSHKFVAHPQSVYSPALRRIPRSRAREQAVARQRDYPCPLSQPLPGGGGTRGNTDVRRLHLAQGVKAASLPAAARGRKNVNPGANPRQRFRIRSTAPVRARRSADPRRRVTSAASVQSGARRLIPSHARGGISRAHAACCRRLRTSRPTRGAAHSSAETPQSTLRSTSPHRAAVSHADRAKPTRPALRCGQARLPSSATRATICWPFSLSPRIPPSVINALTAQGKLPTTYS